MADPIPELAVPPDMLVGMPRKAFVDDLARDLASLADTMAPLVVHQAVRVGVVGDTHCTNPAGADLPSTVLEALTGCDLILHCGDLATLGVLDRLSTVATTVAVRSAIDPPPDQSILYDGPLLVRAGTTLIGMVADLDQAADPTLVFGTDVDVAVSGTTHLPTIGWSGRTLLVNPGSPTLPAAGQATVATIDLNTARPTARIVHVAIQE